MESNTDVSATNQWSAGARFTIADQAGRIVAIAHQKHEQITPKSDSVEHDPKGD